MTRTLALVGLLSLTSLASAQEDGAALAFHAEPQVRATSAERESAAALASPAPPGVGQAAPAPELELEPTDVALRSRPPVVRPGLGVPGVLIALGVAGIAASLLSWAVAALRGWVSCWWEDECSWRVPVGPYVAGLAASIPVLAGGIVALVRRLRLRARIVREAGRSRAALRLQPVAW